jgi:tetrahedral aminopeptidase
MKDLMHLMDLRSPSGRENDVRSYLIKKIKPHCKDIKVDKFGNLIVHQRGKGPAVMLVAHMDEIGLVIQSISNAGIIKVSFVGGIDPSTCLNLRVKIETKKKDTFISGIITTVGISHFLEIEEVPTKGDLIIDSGLNKKELMKLGIGIGTFVEFDAKALFLGSKEYLCGKALDDRVGCYALLELIKKCKKFQTEIYYVFTVQEEVGLYGAKTSIYNIHPEWAIAIDITAANDTEEDAQNITLALGKGPTLTVMDAEFIANKCLNDAIEKISVKKKIPVQKDVSDGGTTDALNISLSKGGVPTTVMGVCVRNLHSTISIAHKKDIEGLINILEELLRSPPKICI